MEGEMHILILEDNKSDLELLQYELKKAGFEFTATTVHNEATFLEALASKRPDIILSDYSLPTFNGLKAFNAKQKTHPDVPFIIVSGTIGEENAVELIKNGVTDYSLKDKLFALGPKINRALKEAKEKKEKQITDEKLKAQYKKLIDIAFMQSHQVRAPVASILGLINLVNFENMSDPANIEVLNNLKKATLMLDDAIKNIVEKTGSENPID